MAIFTITNIIYHILNYSLRFYQLLTFFLKPFGKIGFAPLDQCAHQGFEAGLLLPPDYFIREFEGIKPERIIIPGDVFESILVLNPNEYDKKPLDVSVFYNYWNDGSPNSFLNYITDKYPEYIKPLKRK